jgi:hypothetical protein
LRFFGRTGEVPVGIDSYFPFMIFEEITWRKFIDILENGIGGGNVFQS